MDDWADDSAAVDLAYDLADEIRAQTQPGQIAGETDAWRAASRRLQDAFAGMSSAEADRLLNLGMRLTL